MSLLEKMLKELPFSADELRDVISTAQYRYKVYRIPKRQPNQYRTIAQPSPEVKVIQRWLIANVLATLPVHKVAMAYREGRSIADHAAVHAKNRFLLKLDFSNFFPSISVSDVRRYLVEVAKMSANDARLVSLLVCWRNKVNGDLCLSIGAPTSPLLSNVLLYKFDKKIVQLCRTHRVAYTRYADDLAFSTNKKEVLSEISKQVQAVCESLEYPKLVINSSKTVSTSKAFKRVLVGLVLTPEGAVSLGRDKKRRLRSELYRFSQARLDIDDVPKLRGELAFAWSIEKSFINTLLRQHGREVFRKLDLPFDLDSEEL